MDQVSDALIEASVPEAYQHASSSLAIDWTDHETWSRPRSAEDPQPANDPDTSWGHAKRNAPGAKDGPFFGYYAQVATMVADEGGPIVPELVRRIAVHAPHVDPPTVMTRLLLRLRDAGVALGDVLADCGYSNRDPKTFAVPLRRGGANLVMDLHPGDRGRRGTFEGAIAANGALYCPATPLALLDLGPLKRGATPQEAAAHDAHFAELSRYRFSVLSAPDHDGYQRLLCPAVTGKLRCPLKPASLTRARLTARASSNPPRCHRAVVTSKASPSPRKSTRRPAKSTTTPGRRFAPRTPDAPRPSGPTPRWPIPHLAGSAGDGVGSSAGRRTPSCTPWPSRCATSGSSSPSSGDGPKKPVGSPSAQPGAGAGVTSATRPRSRSPLDRASQLLLDNSTSLAP